MLISPHDGEALSAKSIPSGYVSDRRYTIYTVNESTTVDAKTFWNWTWALQYQVDWHFGPYWNISARFAMLPSSATVPKGGIVLHFSDTLDVKDALGYHDEDRNEVPYAKIGVNTSKRGGMEASAVGSHEALELLVDLHVNLGVVNSKRQQVVEYEVGDPCQGNDYDVGAPEGRPTGVMVADFALPNWFDENTKSTAVTSYRGACTGPFDVAPQGYHGYIDLNAPLDSQGQPNWQQAFGQDHVNVGDPKVVNPE